MRSRSGPLAAWATSWLAGHAASDEVLRAVVAADGRHRVAGLPDGDPDGPLSELLIRWRRHSDRVRLVLPVPGDVRGLPDHAEFRNAALAAGEAVLGGTIGVVPQVFDPSPSSAPVTVTWQAYVVGPAAPDDVALADAQYELAAAIRDAAGALVEAGVSSTNADVAESLSRARRTERVNLPPDHPPRAVALVAQAERLRAVLELALTDAVGVGMTVHQISARDAAMRPLVTAVRRALLAGYNARPIDGTPPASHQP